MRNTFFNSLSKESLLAFLFAGIALVSMSLFFFPSQTQKKIEQSVAGTKTTRVPSLSPQVSNTSHTEMPKNTPTQSSIQQDLPSTQTIQITIAVTPTPQAASEKAIIMVNIDGGSNFTVSLDKGKNQCDVLTESLNQKKISQLLMKYDSSLDSYGVYQINNVGKDNAVWWTYTVNGTSPTQGCNHIAANNGDTVSWKYIGSR
jgi:hypothetical protein